MTQNCTQCRTRAAMYNINGHLLCLNCYAQWAQLTDTAMRQAAHYANYLDEQMRYSMGLSARPPRLQVAQPPVQATIRQGDLTMNTIKIDNSTVGMLNTGHIENVRNIDLNIGSMLREGGTAVAAASGLKGLTEAIAASAEVSDEKKSELLDQVKMLSDETSRPAEQRSKPAIVKAVMTSLATGLSAAGGLAKVWELCGPAICAHLGIDNPFSKQ